MPKRDAERRPGAAGESIDPAAGRRLLFTHETHAVECQGHFYNAADVINYEALCNYLHTVRQGTVVLRTRQVERFEEGWLPLDGPGVDVCPIPEFGRLKALLQSLWRIYRTLASAIRQCDCYVVRLPGPTGTLVALNLLGRGKRFGVEMAGHYEPSLLRQMVKERNLGPAWIPELINKLTAWVVRRAATVAYRSDYLRRLYPSSHPDREFVFSGAVLKPEIVTGPRPASHFTRQPFRIATIGRVATGKNFPGLVRVFARLRERTQVPMALEIIGDGDEMGRVQEEVKRLGLGDLVTLPGRVEWGEKLFGRLDGAHLFVLPSLIEGMPRSLIEAMARGMPVVSTTAGGIPELVDACDLVPPGDEDALVEKIAPLIGDPQRLAEMSRRSFARAQAHSPESLDRAKRAFWGCVLKYTK